MITAKDDSGVMAGWIFFTVSQVVFTSLTLGALKRSGAIQCVPYLQWRCSKFTNTVVIASAGRLAI